jgi:hypothetical protein
MTSIPLNQLGHFRPRDFPKRRNTSCIWEVNAGQ